MSAAIGQIGLKEEKKAKRFVKLETFIDNYTNRDDPFKYEWNKGVVEKKEKTMNRNQFLILQKLTRLFVKTKAYQQGGELVPEVDMFMSKYNRTRRADIAYMTPSQMQNSLNGELSVSPFVIEIISKHDQINEVGEKIIEYFENGVQVLWIVYPKLKKVDVYTSLDNVKICFGETNCTASPILPDFQITTKDLLP